MKKLEKLVAAAKPIERATSGHTYRVSALPPQLSNRMLMLDQTKIRLLWTQKNP
ncbi:hypothetical protein [Methylophilus aquaticus]|uniref:Uncharacterized protein n=1 Tax=Methylophilus aquaticus TaxID=1971610 RepID=A0ABT9JRK5_9PROT|nr:hypothetical protein [Methylophilus aquaticus]MDP8567184.1 hypothetical protein [Methylophilus aquaticus]